MKNTASNIVAIAGTPIQAHIHAEDCEGTCAQLLFDGLLSQWVFPDGSVLRINGSLIEAYETMEECQEVVLRELENLGEMPKPKEGWGPL